MHWVGHLNKAHHRQDLGRDVWRHFARWHRRGLAHWLHAQPSHCLLALGCRTPLPYDVGTCS
jgi:hypothetical protein